MRHRTRLLPAVAAVSLAVAACGGGSGDPQPTTTDTPVTTPAAPPDAGAGDTDSGAGQEADTEVPESLAFTGTTVGGEPFDAATLAGDPVLVWFWAEWCPKCRAAAPAVLDAAEQVSVLGVASLGPADEMQGFVDSTGTGSLTHLADPDGEIWQRFGVVSQDTYALIDAGGEVVHTGPLSDTALLTRVDELTR